MENNETDNLDFTRALQIRLLRHAINHLPDELDPRIGLIAYKNGLTKGAGKTTLSADVLQILEKPKHPKRIRRASGPLIFFREDERTQTYIAIGTVMLSPDMRARKAALNEFSQKEDVYGRFVSPDTDNAIKELAKTTLADNSPSALDAAVKIVDLLDDDFFYQLQGVRQCTGLQLSEELANFLKRVLTPNEEALKFLINLPVWSPQRQGTEIDGMVIRMSKNSATIQELLTDYFRLFGHLPLAGGKSAGSVVNAWKACHEFNGDLWETVWVWAAANGSCLARYHAAQVFCYNSDWIGDDRVAAFLDEIVEIGTRSLESSRWRGRIDLAKHYCRHLELLSPGADSERVAAYAWWLAEQLQSLLESLGAKGRDLSEPVITKTIGTSRDIWTIVRPSVTPSSLCCATHLCENIWAASILSEFSNSRLVSRLSEQTPGFDAIVAAILTPSNIGLGHVHSKVAEYAFEGTLLPLFDHLLPLCVGDVAESLRIGREVFIASLQNDELAVLIKKLARIEPAKAKLISAGLKMQAFQARVPTDKLWDSWSDINWRKDVLLTAELGTVELLCDGMIEILLSDASHEWRSHLPHFFALTAIDVTTDRARRSLLFDYTVKASVAVDSVSAIQRLLTGATKREYLEFIQQWKDRIEQVSKLSPAWIAAKLRGIRVALQI